MEDFANRGLQRKAARAKIKVANRNSLGGKGMSEWLYAAVLAAVVCVVIYLLYCKGFGVLKSTTAILFVFRRGKKAHKATLDSCTGRVKYVGRFRESKVYEFTFDAQLSKGNVEVTLLDKKKQELLKLSRQSSFGKIEIDAKNKYYLRWDFKGATGTCELHW